MDSLHGNRVPARKFKASDVVDGQVPVVERLDSGGDLESTRHWA